MAQRQGSGDQARGRTQISFVSSSVTELGRSAKLTFSFLESGDGARTGSFDIDWGCLAFFLDKFFKLLLSDFIS
ncbi:hypothetical protein MRB53_032438 [Persea americana]|uniref:Uncharacterized protein n=1 Tax=Persea americana TaxID=3435 RepID=A0ACC2KSE9_PERAE|nr:hypothetical protein MRB53_032438 [Persea americana]